MRVGAVVGGVVAVGAVVSSVVGAADGTIGLSSRAANVLPPTTSTPATRTDGAGAAPVLYRPPVQRPVVDGYRAPATPFGPGNRGIDYGTTEGQRVNAAADGVVMFAGQVGGSLHVTIGHADGVRTSYSFLGRVDVRRGATVNRGQRIGAAGDRPLHLGARRGTAYLDPRTLFGDERFTVRLIPARRDP